MKTALTLTLALMVPALSAQAQTPDCALHLQEPARGGTLTQEQLDANNACLAVLQVKRKIAEDLSSIAESEHHAQETLTRSSAHSPAPAPARVVASPAAPPVVTPAAPAPKAAPLPSVEGILWNGSQQTALLSMPDGGTLEARAGTRLPDGSTVVSIRMDETRTEPAGVTIRRDGLLISLSGGSGAQTSTPHASTPSTGQTVMVAPFIGH